MKNTLLLPEIYLHALNAFDVGNNPEHINHGLTKTGLVSWVNNNVDKLSDSNFLTINGHALSLLDEDSQEAIETITRIVKENNISLVGVPYYNTSLSLLSADNFKKQWDKNQQELKNYFGKTAQNIYVADQKMPIHLSSTIKDLGLKIIGDNSLDVESIMLGKESLKQINEDSFIGEHSSYNQANTSSSLADHVSSELLALEPFVMSDGELSSTWQLLANTQLISSLEGGDPQMTYNNYSSMMNILNDIAHTVRNVELTKKGLFETNAQIVENPSEKIFEVLDPNDSRFQVGMK